jgi:hypothetical protein
MAENEMDLRLNEGFWLIKRILIKNLLRVKKETKEREIFLLF